MKSIIKRFVPGFVLSWYHLGWAFFGATIYGFPANKLIVIGVTGTDGKSTTTEMIRTILQEAGHTVCSTSSVWFQIANKKEKNHLKMGMPGRMFLQKFLRDAVKKGCTYAVIEVSSEGILQNRHRFLNFHTAVITNLSPEHIERHGTFEKYRAEKQKLFRIAKQAHILNIDDENVEHFLKPEARERWGYGVKNLNFQFPISNQTPASSADRPESKSQTLFASNIQETKDGTNFLVNGAEFHLNLIGKFNTYNALAAICVALAHGISLEVCKTGLAKMPRMPGRTDVVIKEPFTVLIDYAVTPKAFENLYKGVQRLFEPKKLICVFGACGGGRDKWKRPILGKIASQYCDEIFITNEDPYSEDPHQILLDIKSGVSRAVYPEHSRGESRGCSEVLDRREAIAKALSVASQGDVVVVSGKGSEDTMAIADGKKIPWDERKVIEEEFNALNRSTDV